MKKTIWFLSVFLTACTIQSAEKTEWRQVYGLDPARIKKNEALVAKDVSEAPNPWKNAPIAYYAVPAISPIKRLPDVYPSDGKAFADLEIIAAKNSYEPASIVFFPRADIARFELRAGNLTSGNNIIPSSNIDIKVVKVWYQGGTAWHSYFSDPLVRKLVPELLLYDERLIRVDTDTKDNYVRYNNADGSTTYAWMSFTFPMVNYTFTGQANFDLISDADTLQPVVLNRNEFKQFFATVHIPENAVPGIYKGEIEMTADGRTVGAVPIKLKVLPFTLPVARTNYDLSKQFHLILYWTRCHTPAILKNLARHNALSHFNMPNINTFNPEEFIKDIELAELFGFSTRPVFGGPSANLETDPENPSVLQQVKLEILRKEMEDAAALCREHLGHSDFYCYGVDEGSPDRVRKQRATWNIVHESGGKVMVSTHPRDRLLFALDYMIMPGMPTQHREQAVRKFHEANPRGLVGWYADPHTGPENPHYMRRTHGMMAYKSNYDASANYVWWRNNWNDFAVPYEPFFRGIMTVYAQKDNVIDTLAWEGLREGMDDIRYATKLKMLAEKAYESGNGRTALLGRKAMGYLAYSDATRDDMDMIRMECINYIIQLKKALEGDI